MIWKFCEEVARMGFVVVAPMTGTCNGHGMDMFDATWKSKSDNPLHPALAHVDWNRTAIFGHSFGGDHAAGVATWAGGSWGGMKAAVISHSFEYGKNIGGITMPVMCMSGSRDGRANRGMLPQYYASKAESKVYAAVQGGGHMEPAQGGRLNKYAAHFLACHVQESQASCDKVYGHAEDSMCSTVDTSICLRSAAPDFSPPDSNATTTSYTSARTTSTRTSRFLSSTTTATITATTTTTTGAAPSPKTCHADCAMWSEGRQWWTTYPWNGKEGVPMCFWWKCNGCSQCQKAPGGCIDWCNHQKALDSKTRTCTVNDACADCDICK